MAYMNYNNAMYRTGFRPYGQTNPWAASQLNGYSIRDAALSGYLGQVHPFGPWQLHGAPVRGFRGIGQSHPFTDAGGWRLHGLGQDSTDVFSSDYNPLVLQDTSTPIGVPYANAPAYSPAVPINAPSGVYDPVTGTYVASLPTADNPTAGTGPIATTQSYSSPVTLAPGAAPRVAVPISLFPQTAPVAAVPQAASILGQSSIIKGIPDILLYAVAGLAAITFIGGSSGGGRRR